MTNSRLLATRLIVLSGLGMSMFALMGCGTSPGEKAELPPPIVTVAPPSQHLVTRYEHATGRVESVEKIEIRARVSGYLNKILFQPGQEVSKDQKLYEIDPLPFKADQEKARASKAVAEADLATNQADLLRAKARADTTKKEYERVLVAFDKKAASAQDRDKAKGDYDEAAATVNATDAKINSAKAQIELAAANVTIAGLNLGYCTVLSPINGIIGDKLVTEGNLISGGVTELTTIVSFDPMDIGFDVDENTVQRLQQAVRDKKIKSPGPDKLAVEGGLALHGAEYPLTKGIINFQDNRVDKKTGTIHMKARFDNPKPENGPRLLTAGMYARVRAPIGPATQSMLVPDAALGSDQGIRFLYLIGPDNKAVRYDAALGNLVGDQRVIESIQVPGEKPRPLTLEDSVIVSGLQRVRPGMTVDPKPRS